MSISRASTPDKSDTNIGNGQFGWRHRRPSRPRRAGEITEVSVTDYAELITDVDWDPSTLGHSPHQAYRSDDGEVATQIDVTAVISNG